MTPTQQFLTDVTPDEVLTPGGFDRAQREILERKIKVWPARAATPIRDIYWLAALLEGEGYFRTQGPGYIAINLSMTDRDVVERAARIMGFPISRLSIVPPPKPNYKTKYVFSVCGLGAASWMMTLYPIMGLRRRGQIRRCLAGWRRIAIAAKDRTACPQGHAYSDPTYKGTRRRRRCRACSAEEQRRLRVRHGSRRDRRLKRLRAA